MYKIAPNRIRILVAENAHTRDSYLSCLTNAWYAHEHNGWSTAGFSSLFTCYANEVNINWNIPEITIGCVQHDGCVDRWQWWCQKYWVTIYRKINRDILSVFISWLLNVIKHSCSPYNILTSTSITNRPNLNVVWHLNACTLTTNKCW